MRFLLLFLWIFGLHCADASVDDPFAETDYEKAFCLEKYQKLERANTGEDQIPGIFLKDLNREKNKSALKPVIHAGIDALVKAFCIVGLIKLWGAAELDTSYEILIGALTGIGVSNFTKFTLMYVDPLRDHFKRWEDEFISKMHVVQPRLWPKIINAFEKGRRGQIERDALEQFFTIAFNLPAVCPQPYLIPNEQANANLDQVNDFTSTVLSSYEENETTRTAELLLKSCNRQYFQTIYVGEEKITAIHLHSPSGTGKHTFLQELTKKLANYFEGFQLEEINECRSSAELIGTESIPGKLLKALSNFYRKNAPYGMIVLNSYRDRFDTELVKTVETIFSDGTFKPSYLQRDGYDDVTIPLKNYFFVLLSNERDEFQRSKIITTRFPEKLKETILMEITWKNV